MQAVKPSPNVRISRRAHKLLQQLAQDADESMQATLDKAIEQYRRVEFLRAANREYASLRRNSKAWKETVREREAWDQTTDDGLETR